MAATDVLKSLRGSGYGDKGSGNKDEMKPKDANSTSRVIKLTDDEQQAFADAAPGEDLACEVHGTLEADGHFHVMSVGPMGGGDDDSQRPDQSDMASEVAQRVQPNIAPSPS